MAGRPKICENIVTAHRTRSINLENMTIEDIKTMFECSEYTARRARKECGINRPPQVIRKFPDQDKWNAGRRDLLQRWGR